MRISTAIVLLTLIGGISACGSSPSAPTTPPPPPPPIVLAVFSDPDSTLTTTDVRDVNEQIVRFDTANNALIWTATARSFSGYPVSGYLIASNFQVRFGTKDGERRAYFTERGPATICDIDVVNGQLVILPTNVPVPTEPPPPQVLAVFSDSSGFMTSDVRDVQGQIVRFDTANNALIWAATDRSFSGYPVSGNFIGSNRAFQVRFGTEAGERRAYFTETGPETICDIDVVNGQLVILPTNVRVPGGGD